MRDALRRGMGETTFAHVRASSTPATARRLHRARRPEARDRTILSTPETIANERANVAHVMRGQNTVEPIMTQEQAAAQASTRRFSMKPEPVIADVLTSTDRIHGVQGLAGTGKTTVLSSIREGAEAVAIRSKASPQHPGQPVSFERKESKPRPCKASLRVRRTANANPASRHLYMLDESSLASTKQMRSFLDKIGPKDRVLVIGDIASIRASTQAGPSSRCRTPECGPRNSIRSCARKIRRC